MATIAMMTPTMQTTLIIDVGCCDRATPTPKCQHCCQHRIRRGGRHRRQWVVQWQAASSQAEAGGVGRCRAPAGGVKVTGFRSGMTLLT
ncbi:hypothetical protein ACLOJK_006767 [Asimina triloba]